MGSSRPLAADIDLVFSYARRVDGDVELVLADPRCDVGDESPMVVLRQPGKGAVRRRSTLVDDEGGRRLVVRFPRRRLTRGTWSVSVRGPRGRVPLQVRLLIQGRRPVVLLWGRHASPSQLPVAHARPQSEGRRSGLVRTLGARAPQGVRRRVRRLRHRLG